MVTLYISGNLKQSMSLKRKCSIVTCFFAKPVSPISRSNCKGGSASSALLLRLPMKTFQFSALIKPLLLSHILENAFLHLLTSDYVELNIFPC